jgi:large conductance mechanosensitive channel
MLANLKLFLVRDNVLALAVGIIIGSAFGKIVTTMVDKLIMPVIGILLGGLDFKGLNLTIGNAVVGYGEVIQAILDFIIIGIVLYFLLKAAGQKPGPPAPSPSEVLLAEIRDELRRTQ